MSDIESRLTALESAVAQTKPPSLENARDTFTLRAEYHALYSLVMDLAERLGVRRVDVLRHHDIRTRYYRDRLLALVENVSPERAAELDARNQAMDPPIEGYYPPLFETEGPKK